MKILDIRQLDAPYSFERDGGDKDRTPESADAVSVTTVEAYIANKFGFDNYDVDFASEQMKIKAWMGLAFEDRMAKDLHRVLPGHVSWPGELWTPNGKVMGHPEGYYDGSVTALGVFEFKHTYTSSSHYDSKEAWERADSGMAWHYKFQVCSYVAMSWKCGLDCREATIIILNNMGAYSGERRSPEFNQVLMEFSEQDLEHQIVILEKSAPKAWAWASGGGK